MEEEKEREEEGEGGERPMPPFITFFLGLARLRGKREGRGRGDHSALFQRERRANRERAVSSVLCSSTSRTAFDGRETLFVSLPLCARPSPGPSLPPSARIEKEDLYRR